MVPHGIRPPGRWNKAFVNKITFTWPVVLKYVKIFTDFKAYMVYRGSLSLCDVRQQPVTCKSELFVLIEDNMACFNENTRE